MDIVLLIWDVILREFRLPKIFIFLLLNFLEFVGNGIGMPV